MKNKKNLKALLEKQKKKKTGQNTTSAAKEDEDATLAAETSGKQDTPNEAESPDLPSSGLGQKQRDNNDDSSDDELKYKLEVKHEIVEAQADQSKKQDVVEVPDYMKQKDDKDDGAANQKQKVKRADGSNIKFTGRPPTFSNRQKTAGIGGEDFQGLDEIDDQGKIQKKSRKPAEGGKEFVHMGSTAVDKNRKEEEKSAEIKTTGRRPMFTGKAKIGGGSTAEQTGPNIQYDFGVKYKTTGGPDDAKKGQQDKKTEGGQNEVRKDKRNIHQNKGRFGNNNAPLDDQDLDEGFEIVRDPNQKRRQQRMNRNREEEDFSRKGEGDKKESTLKKGGAFGNLGDSD